MYIILHATEFFWVWMRDKLDEKGENMREIGNQNTLKKHAEEPAGRVYGRTNSSFFFRNTNMKSLERERIYGSNDQKKKERKTLFSDFN